MKSTFLYIKKIKFKFFYVLRINLQPLTRQDQNKYLPGATQLIRSRCYFFFLVCCCGLVVQLNVDEQGRNNERAFNADFCRILDRQIVTSFHPVSLRLRKGLTFSVHHTLSLSLFVSLSHPCAFLVSY